MTPYGNTRPKTNSRQQFAAQRVLEFLGSRWAPTSDGAFFVYDQLKTRLDRKQLAELRRECGLRSDQVERGLDVLEAEGVLFVEIGGDGGYILHRPPIEQEADDDGEREASAQAQIIKPIPARRQLARRRA